MSVLMALLLAATPNAAPAADPAQAKPRKKCEYVSEVGSNRPRRVCTVVLPKAPEEQAKTDAARPAGDHSEHKAGAED
jgi:hypothetical protein